jgi:MFS family permease
VGSTPLIPSLPRRAWIILGGDMLSAVGSGMTMPFFVVYLHRVRGVSLLAAGLALAMVAVASVAGNVIGGSLADRFGARRALMVGLGVAAAGATWFAFVHSVPSAFGAAAVIGLGASIAWPAADALLASVVDESQRSGVFAVRHGTMNAGFGIGAVIAATIVDVATPRSFELLYIVDAATFLAFVPLLAALRGVGERVAPEDVGAGGYRVVLADRTFVAVWLLTALLVVVGYAQYEAAVPLYATGTGGISAHSLGAVFAANTFAIAVLQLVVLRLLAGRRRTTALVLASVALGSAWCVAIAAAHVGGGSAAVVGFACAMAVLALFETLLAPVLAPLVNDLAPERLRGRYNGTFVLAYTTGFAVGPALAGAGLGIGDGTPYFALLLVGSAVAAIGGLGLRRRLPARLDLVGPSHVEAPILQPEVV